MRKTTEFSMSFPIDHFQKFSNFSVGGRVVAQLLQEARSKGHCGRSSGFHGKNSRALVLHHLFTLNDLMLAMVDKVNGIHSIDRKRIVSVPAN
jgi:hypothetical protein